MAMFGKRRLVAGAAALAGLVAATLMGAAPASTAEPVSTSVLAAGSTMVGYFTNWGIYDRGYQVKNLETSGTAAKLNVINYAFGSTANGQCSLTDAYADYQKVFDAGSSVDGKADTGPLYGNFGQLRKLKKMHPGLKVVFSVGGWTLSGGFTQAAKNPAAFASSCYSMVKDSRWAHSSVGKRIGLSR